VVSALRCWREQIDLTHLRSKHFPGRLESPLSPAESLPMRSGQRTLQRRCDDFDRPYLHPFFYQKIFLLTFEARRSTAKSHSKAVLIAHPGIGGTKRFGRGVNGICNWRMIFWCAVTRVGRSGRSMVFTTDDCRLCHTS